MKRPRYLLLVIVLFVCSVTVALDRLFYGTVIFLPEYHGGWDQFRWYAFEYNLRRIKAERRSPPGRPLIVVVGSSIAKYSVQERLLAGAISSRLNRAVDVRMVTHASMLPTDIRYYLPRIRELQPSLVVYLTNPADFDLERYVPPWEVGPAYSRKSAENYIRLRRPMLVFYPGPFALDYTSVLSVSEQLRLHLRQSLLSLRFQDEWIDPWLYNIRTRRGIMHGYLNYQGRKIREGLWREGHTGGCLTVKAAELTADRRLEAEVPAKLAALPDFRIHVFALRENVSHESTASREDCSIPHGAIALPSLRVKRSGWFRLPPVNRNPPGAPDVNEPERYFLLLNHVLDDDGNPLPVKPADPIWLGRGLRLPGNFGMSHPPREDWLVRRRSLEDIRLSHYSPAEARLMFERRIQPPDWREKRHQAVHQLNRLRLAKYITNWVPFTEILQMRDLRFAVSAITPRSRVLIINNPENPLTFEVYGGSRWYRGYLKYLQSLSRENDAVSFVDLKQFLPVNGFSDPHHLTYDGMVRVIPVYARHIITALKAGGVGDGR